MECCDSKNIIEEKEMYFCTNCANTWIYMDRI